MTAVKQPTLTLGDRLRRTRMDANLTTTEMAKLLYMSRNIVNKWEKDENRPTDLKLQQWAEVIAKHSDYTVDGLLKFLSVDAVTKITKISERRRQTERRTQRKERYTCSPVDRTEKRLADRHLQSVQLLAAS